MSWLSSAIHNVETAVNNFFNSLPAEGKKLLAYLEPVFQSEGSAIINQLITIGEPIVTALESTGNITNAQRNTAITQLASAAESIGLNAGEQLLSNAIAFIAAKLQAAAPAVAAAASGGAGVSAAAGSTNANAAGQ